MNNIQVFATRGGENILNNLFISIDGKKIAIECKQIFKKQYNIRFITEIVNQTLSYPDEILGNKLTDISLGNFLINRKSELIVSSTDNSLNNNLKLEFTPKKYDIGIKIYESNPIHYQGVLDAIPVPTEIINVYIYFAESEIKNIKTNTIQHFFDSYNHLGFFLTDLPRMKDVIEKEYGQKDLDLVHEFSNSEIIEKLFEEEIIMIVWGINPYTYPIYSSQNTELIKPLLGRKFEQEGIFNIDENINELSIVPGYELNNWPKFLEKEWPKIKIQGKGKKTHLTPFCLEDNDLETVITSFLIERKEGDLEESKPLVNVDLLYS
ncbi:hypothetical protein Q4603_21895 [Zobellia galactanivorans]|uniref:hypothetical protein n=1 Tax=Zobellia galactanivorans (strain DSM 12802 / CCUG 47099 / CIP 106680 / NCIMB 13871 / Dsij) TaxID=63186 RepID=UPI0026E30E16|nr:hypothetical protein [Zobellia galactanivorans]MDO6811284.1 hypothetical protein [Zobellia galactanivorans]